MDVMKTACVILAAAGVALMAAGVAAGEEAPPADLLPSPVSV